MRRRDFVKAAAVSAAAWPLVARAQQAAKLPTVGVLVSAAADDWASRIAAFRQALSDTGYTEGSNVALLYRYAENRYERLPEMALDLVRQNVDVMLACGGDIAIKAAMAATSTIPIVFTTANDPVTAGYVKSLNRPGGNLTGVTFLASSLEAKRLELLHEIAPKAASFAVMMGSANSNTRHESDRRELEAAAKSLGVSVRVVSIGGEGDLAPAFRDVVAHREDAIHIVTGPFFAARARTLAALAGATALPASFSERDFATAGGLLSYGAASTSTYRDVGTYVGRILKGAAPAELPVQESTKIELIINLKTAKTLGLTVPLPLLGRADEVIE
jgi:putative tryptophan/tyrosine transport system substrate-binding protein